MIGRRTLAAALSALVLVLSVALAEAADKKVIRLWQTETEPQTLAVLNQMAAEYEKTHPDVSVKIEGLAWGDLEKKLTAALAAGAPPAAAHGPPITCVSFAAKGLLRPVDDLADSIPKDNLVDAFRHLCQWNGKTYGVGHSPASSVFVYRKDLLAQKGLKVPRTWDELVQVAEALKEVRDGQVVRWGLTMTGQPLFINIAVGELLKPNGGRLVDAKGAPEAVDFLKFFFQDENYVPYLHSVPIHLLSIKKSTSRNPRYADNAMIRKWRPWVDMQEKYFRNDWIKPVLVTDWEDMKKPYLLEVMGSGILVDMVLDAVKGVPSAEAAARAQKRVEELLASSGYLKK